MVYDVQELFRWLVDLSVLQLLEEKKLRKTDFIVTENYHLRLKPATAKMLIEKFRLNMDKKMQYKHGKQYSYQTILFDCVQELANFTIGKRKDLPFTAPELTIQRTDSIDLQRRIRLMTPAKRKKLGINKSTLWYQKKNLMVGKRITVYDKVLAKLP